MLAVNRNYYPLPAILNCPTLTWLTVHWIGLELWHPSALCSLPGCWPDMSRVRLHVIGSVPHSWQRDLAPSLLLYFDFPALLCFVDPELPVRSGLWMHPNIIRLFSNIAISFVQPLSPICMSCFLLNTNRVSIWYSQRSKCVFTQPTFFGKFHL